MTNRDNVPRMKSKNGLGWSARSLQCQLQLSLPKYRQTNIIPRRLLSREFVDGKRKQHFAYITGFFSVHRLTWLTLENQKMQLWK